LISKSHHWNNDRCPPCLRTPVHHVSGLYTACSAG